MIKEILSIIGIASALVGGTAHAQSTLWNTAPSVSAPQVTESTQAEETFAPTPARYAGRHQIALRPEYELYHAPAEADLVPA